MSASNPIPSKSRPAWFPKMMRLSACIALTLLIAAWCCNVSAASMAFRVLLAGLAALVAGTASALDVRPQPGRLALFGKAKVQVRSLDEWTQYQYNLLFEEASPDQQNEALSHYRVGLRLLPARPQDSQQKQGGWQWLLSFVVFCSFMTLSAAMQGWYRLLLVSAFSAWLWIWLGLSKQYSEVPATNSLTGLDLS